MKQSVCLEVEPADISIIFFCFLFFHHLIVSKSLYKVILELI